MLPDPITARLAASPSHPNGYAWWQAYRQDVTALRARLTTAETEVAELRQGAFGVALTENGVLRHKLAAAEARVEAAEQAADSIIDLAQTFILAGDRAKFLARVAAIRPGPAHAALACPPQQRGE